MGFFSRLKQTPGIPEAPSPIEEPTSGSSFFSRLKQTQGVPTPEPEVNEFEDRPETIRERIGRGQSEVGPQIATGVASGFLGGYGNLLQTVGLNQPEGYIQPGERAGYELESRLAEKINTPGSKPSVAEIYALGEGPDVIPRFSRLPTSAETARRIEEAGGPGEPVTPEGKVVRRAAEIYGGGVALLGPKGAGVKAGIRPSALAGAAGEGIKELGGGPLTQAAGEIAAILLSQGRSGVAALTSKDPLVKARIDTLRALGYTDQDITLAVNASKAGSNRTATAKPTSASEKAFEAATGKSEALTADILEQAFPGISKGTEYLHDISRDIYGKVADNAKKVVIKDATPLNNTIESVIEDLENTLGKNPENSEFIQRLKSAAEDARESTSGPKLNVKESGEVPIHHPKAPLKPGAGTAAPYINFYKELNSRGNWADPKKKEIILTRIKEAIKNTFRKAGPEGEQLFQEFEQANLGVRRAYQAQDVAELLQKGHVEGAIDWAKTLKLFDKQKTWDILEAGLGKEQAKNLHEIAKAGRDIGELNAALGSKVGGKLFEKGSTTISSLGLMWSLWTHNPKFAIYSAGLKIAAKLGKAGYARLQTRLLTDPKFQNLTLKTMRAVKSGSPEAITRAAADFQKEVDESEQ